MGSCHAGLATPSAAGGASGHARQATAVCAFAPLAVQGLITALLVKCQLNAHSLDAAAHGFLIDYLVVVMVLAWHGRAVV